MTQSVDVVCLKHGDKIYDWTWVDRLYLGAKKSLSRPINFHVFTDKPPDNPNPLYNYIQLPHLEGLHAWKARSAAWWYKMFIFSNLHPVSDRQIIYFDLDLVFIGNCDFLLDTPEDMFGCRLDYSYDMFHRHKWLMNSSVLVFKPSEFSYMWEFYINDRRRWEHSFHGDQDFISMYIDQTKLHWFDESKMYSWKYNVWRGGRNKLPGNPDRCILNTNTYVIPPDTRILVFNGYGEKPSYFQHIDVVKENWVDLL